jgi:hypothetical protein
MYTIRSVLLHDVRGVRFPVPVAADEHEASLKGAIPHDQGSGLC